MPENKYMEILIYIIVIYELIINLFTFILYEVDKFKAKRDKYRVPEAELLFFAFIGGALGAFLGMKFFHHKTLKLKFKLVPVLLVVQAALAVYGLYIITRIQFKG